MIPADQLARARAAAEDIQSDTIVVYKSTLTGNTTTLVTTETREQHYPPASSGKTSGPGRLRYPTTTVVEVNPGGQSVAKQTPTLSVPVSTSGDIQTDDVVEWLTSIENPNLVGKKFRIKGQHDASASTAARFPLEQLS